MADKTPEEIANDFKRLQSLATALGKDLNKFNLKPVAEDAALIGELLGKWSDELDNTAASAVDIASGFKSVVQEISKGNVGLSVTKKTFNGLTSIAQKLSYEQAGINKLTLKELKAQKEKAEQAQISAKIANDELEKRKQALIDENKIDDISLAQKKKNREEIKSIKTAIGENSALIDNQSATYQDLLSTLDDRIKSETKINELMGLGGAAIESVGGALDKLGMGGLKEALGLDEVGEKMREIAEEIEAAGGESDSFANKFEVLKGGVKEAGSQLVENLTDPLAVAGFLTTQLVDALLSVDKQAGELAKNFGISYDAALGLKSELTSAANQSYLLNINSEGLVESFTTLNNLFGTFGQINEQVLEDFSRLTGEANLSNEAASALYKTTLLTGKGLEDSTKEFAGQAQALAMQNGLALNQKQILEAVKDISSSTLLQLQGQPEALAEAVVNAKALGVDLAKVEQIASSLLDFESSISNELEAELLTGKQLNLERARLAALNGDIATVAEEIAKQTGDAADFAKMNVIQQDALAKSVGMTRDDLAKSLMEREALVKLSEVEGKTAQEKFNNLVKEVGLEEAKKQLGDEQLSNLYSQQNVQERFIDAVEKLKDIFVAIAEPVLKIVSPFVDLVTTILPAVNALLNPILKYAKEIAAVFGSIYLTSKLMVATNAFLLIQEQAKTTQKGIQLGFTETLLTMMGFENALAGYRLAREEGMNILRAIGVALEETKLGSIIAQGYGIVKNIGKLAIENTARLLGMTTALTTNAAVTFGAGVAIAIGAALAGVAAIKAITADDMAQDGYGKRTILSPEGAIRLNDNDTIIAGTNLGGGGDSSTTTQTGGASIDITPLVNRMIAVENVLVQILNKEGTVNLDGNKVGEVLSMIPVKA